MKKITLNRIQVLIACSALSLIGATRDTKTIVIKQVTVATELPPVLDLIGDGSGALGRLCESKDDSNPSPHSKTDCQCRLSYRMYPDYAQEIIVDVPVTYHEADLLRCSYATIPPHVTWVTASVQIPAIAFQSNEVATQLINIDTARASSFQKAIRYQCRESVTIPYSLDNSVYDPLQSEDPHLNYPLDFYSTNLGGTLATLAESQVNASSPAWKCPSILTPHKYLNEDALTPFAQSNQLNLRVFSKAPLEGTKSIFPTHAGKFDRSSFYLTKRASGAFSVPLKVKLPDETLTTMGYGASSQSSGACPGSSVQIPPGYHWVKVWLFRAALPQRHYFTSSDLVNLREIFCNPGDWKEGGDPVFPGCGQEKAKGGTSISLRDLLFPGRPFADRVWGNGDCLHLDDESGTACGSHPGVGCTTDGYDLWKGQEASSVSESFTTQQLQIRDINTESRYDFLFVVTPPGIDVSDMIDTSPSSKGQPYQPYRFYLAEDCPGDCRSTHTISYGLKLHGVQNNGDTPPESPGLAPVFPVCAIQENL